jgi:hypothetical protein
VAVVADRSDEATGSYRERIIAAAAAVDELDEALKLARRARDELIVEAIENDLCSERDVARWARLSQPRINGILSAH